MSCVASLPYQLEETCPVPWNESVEGQLHRDYPFLNQDSSDQDFVIRRYLETLWLPESFSPFSYLINSLRRVLPKGPENSCLPHPLHSLLEPVLLSTRAASDKYRTELVQILADGGGAGEQEEMMMWYAWDFEKAENEEDGTVDEEKWRKGWLERLERREVMIQILLLMLKLSIPSTIPAKSEKRPKRKSRGKQEPPAETTEDRLESYMDKLTVWQLTGTLGPLQSSSQSTGSGHVTSNEDKHWTQTFYEDVVAPLFKLVLPDQCELMRTKLYPDQAASDNEESEAESLLNGGVSRAGSRAPSVARIPFSRKPSTSISAGPQLQRSRSRSLSVSLAQDEASQRASIVAPKQSLSREVSMSRNLKEKPKVSGRLATSNDSRKPEPDKTKIKRRVGMTLVQETPAKRKSSDSVRCEEVTWNNWNQGSGPRFGVPSPPATSSSEPGDIFIEDTPLAARTRQLGERVESLSPLTPLQDESPMMSVVESARTRGKKTSALKASRASSSRKRCQLQSKARPGRINFNHDEHSDGSFVDSFKLSKVTLLDGDDNHAMIVSPSPMTRTKKGEFFGVGDGVKRAGLFGSSAEDVAMATPTKKKVRRR